MSLAALVLGALLAAPARAQPPAPADAKPKRPARVLPGEEIELKTKDGWTLSAKYLPAKDGSYTFILLHGTGGRKEDWYFLGKAMAKKGLGYLALDLRGHGASLGAPPGQPSQWRKFPAPTKAYNEWNNMTLDVDAAGEFLQSKGVPPATVALGGADVGSSIALKYAAVHAQVPLVFLLSPGMSYKEVLTVNAIRAYSQRPILLMVGADDSRSTRETAILYEFAKRSAGPQNTALITAEREHGARMLVVNKGLIGKLLDWVQNPQASQAPEASTPTAPGQEPAPLEGEGAAAPTPEPPPAE